MKKLFLPLLCALLLLASCDDHKESLRINDTSEVLYKGDGVKEADAKNLGNFLLKQGYFTTSEHRSVQLTRDGENYVVRFIMEEEKIRNQDSASLATGFKVWQMWIQDNVFKGAKTKLVLADATMKDIREVGEFTQQEREEMSSEEYSTGSAETFPAGQATPVKWDNVVVTTDSSKR